MGGQLTDILSYHAMLKACNVTVEMTDNRHLFPTEFTILIITIAKKNNSKRQNKHGQTNNEITRQTKKQSA